MIGAATAKLREPKHIQTRGTDSKLESDERKLRDGTFIKCCLHNTSQAHVQNNDQLFGTMIGSITVLCNLQFDNHPNLHFQRERDCSLCLIYNVILSIGSKLPDP